MPNSGALRSVKCNCIGVFGITNVRFRKLRGGQGGIHHLGNCDCFIGARLIGRSWHSVRATSAEATSASVAIEAQTNVTPTESRS